MAVFGKGCNSLIYFDGQVDYQINDIYFQDPYGDLIISILVQNGGLPLTLTPRTDYQISVNPPLNSEHYKVYNGGVITLSNSIISNLHTGDVLFVYRETDIVQPLRVSEITDNYDLSLEIQLDKIVKMIQDIKCTANDRLLKELQSQPDGVYIMGVSNGHIFVVPNPLPDPSTLTDGNIIAVQGGVYTDVPNIAVGRELPLQHAADAGKILQTDGVNPLWITIPSQFPDQSGHDGEHLATDGTTVQWVAPPIGVPTQTTADSGKILQADGTTSQWIDIPTQFPDQSGHDGEHLATDGITVQWVAPPIGVPTQTTADSGKILQADGTTSQWIDIPTQFPDQSGHDGQFLSTDGTTVQWLPVGGENPAKIEDASGVLTGYSLNIASDTEINISALSARFLVNAQRLEIDYQGGTVTKPDGDGVFYVVLDSTGAVTFRPLRPEVYDGTVVTLGSILSINNAISDFETSATNLKGLSDQIKYLSNIVGGRIFNAFLASEGDDSLQMNSLITGIADLWRYGLNSTTLGNYNFAEWTFTNPISYTFVSGDGDQTAITQAFDFRNIPVYRSDGTFDVLGPSDFTLALVYILPNKPDVLFLSVGLGEYDVNNDDVKSIDTLLLAYRDIIPQILGIYGICIGAVKFVYGKDFSTASGSEVIPYGGEYSTGGSTGSDSLQHVFDLSSSILGGIEIAVASTDTINITTSGEAVFVDLNSNTFSRVPLSDVSGLAVDVTTGNVSYLYLDKNGTFSIDAALIAQPNVDKILIGTISHYNDAIDGVYSDFPLGEFDTLRIKDLYKDISPSVRGLVPTLNNVINGTDIVQSINLGAGTFLSYYYKGNIATLSDISFRFFTPPIGYLRDGYVTDSTADTFSALPLVAKIYDENGSALVDLPEDGTAVYPLYFRTDGSDTELIAVIPHSIVPFRVEGEDFIREMESYIPSFILDNFAQVGFLFAKNDEGTIEWTTSTDIEAVRDVTGLSGYLTIPNTRKSVALIEHVNGQLREIDYTKYNEQLFHMSNFTLKEIAIISYRHLEDIIGTSNIPQTYNSVPITQIGSSRVLTFDSKVTNYTPADLNTSTSIPFEMTAEYLSELNYNDRIFSLFIKNIGNIPYFVHEFKYDVTFTANRDLSIGLLFAVFLDTSSSPNVTVVLENTTLTCTYEINLPWVTVSILEPITSGSTHTIRIILTNPIDSPNIITTNHDFYIEWNRYDTSHINFTGLIDFYTASNIDYETFDIGPLKNFDITTNTGDYMVPVPKYPIGGLIPGDIVIIYYRNNNKLHPVPRVANFKYISKYVPSLFLEDGLGNTLSANYVGNTCTTNNYYVNDTPSILKFVFKDVTQDMIDNWNLNLREFNVSDQNPFVGDLESIISVANASDLFDI